MAGFGGVAEYGITVRWDKNFLKIVRLLLERRAQFALYGGVRFGGTLESSDAFALGFDHVALAPARAGRRCSMPPNGLAHGVRTASDFLMALQLTGAGKSDSIANMQVRLPVVVIGGGLTAIDTATERSPTTRCRSRSSSRATRRSPRSAARRPRSRAWLDRGGARSPTSSSRMRARFARARARAARARAPTRSLRAAAGWGGVTIAYRAPDRQPAYTLNHEEVEKALEEGIASPRPDARSRSRVDDAAPAMAFVASQVHGGRGSGPRPACTAAGADDPRRGGHAAEHGARARGPGHVRARRQVLPVARRGRTPVQPVKRLAKPASRRSDLVRRRTALVSFFGDLHPSLAGNVVKAMASAKQGYPIVDRACSPRDASAEREQARVLRALDDELRATRRAVDPAHADDRRSRGARAAAARRFQPGQFYRLQNFETRAARRRHAARDGRPRAHRRVGRPREGLVSTIVLEMGGSSTCARCSSRASRSC